MQGLAEFIMRGRRQATLVVGLSVAVPLLFWFGAVVLALVLLRRGWSEGMSVVVWGALPALAWALIGDPTPLLVLLGSAALALLLRQRSEWSLVTMAAAPLGLVFALVLMATLQAPLQQLAEQIQAALPQMLSELGEVDEAALARLQTMLVPLLAGLMGATHAAMTLVSLMLARAWQARLYNPGGFREEFHRLRLAPWMGLVLLLAVFGAPQVDGLVLLAPVATVPLLFAGLALVHGVVGIKRLGIGPLVVLYVALLFVWQVLYPLIMILAFIDSLFDFRSRLQPVSGGGNDDSNGQG
ncbi:hypothetical protein CNQ84_03015 [Pseudomonas abyssi]|uniref:DUF2232 domain-containing protein n=1 Tax=Pseudomonas abyssi TaxID=170540 RepID=A0A2A3MKX0_9PSED|nr:hypothetical protein [Pseudomonadales bacterium]MAG66631.1 hypothetical protein [Pseudomonadales bacterium]PBK05490.1 hypothetical protein CNQ84_03015 [Pseudomonas abyssi]|tara:strand:+ start:280 stop:1173 length:894 start_codon:yes stop_codon:yes gene_type:complete